MPITVELLPNEPIIVATMREPIDYNDEVPPMFTQMLELRDTELAGKFKKYYVVIDMIGIKPSFSEIVFSLNEARKTGQKRLPDLPMSLNLVGAGDLFEMVANALRQTQYGEYKAPLQPTLEKTLEAIRADMQTG